MTKKDRQLKKKIKNNQITCQTFFEIKEITDDSILTTHNEELFLFAYSQKILLYLMIQTKILSYHSLLT